MTKQRIAIDVDEVLAAGAQSFVDFSNQTWGTHLTIDDYNERWSEMWGVDIAEEERRAQAICQSGRVRRAAKIDGASEAIARLGQEYVLCVLSSRASNIKQDTLDWINEYFSGVFKEIHFTGFYDGLSGKAHLQTKADFCVAIGADYLIDDQPKHCFAAAEAGVTSILFGNYAWNRKVDVSKNMVRAFTWQEVSEFFDGLG